MVITPVEIKQTVSLLVRSKKDIATAARARSLAYYSRLYHHKQQQLQPQPQRSHTATNSAGFPHATAFSPTARGPYPRSLTTSPIRTLQDPKMATDNEYMDFLNKANEDPTQGSVSAQGQQSKGKKELKAADHGAEIPQPLVAATQDAFYVSDADEPFVPVSLAWEKGEGLPNEEEIARLVDHWDPSKAEIEILDPVDWDRNGEYKEIVDAVRKAGKGNDVRVYRIVKDRSRVEYFVVTRQGDGTSARLVGVKALAIES
ncbi:hypothetical protein VP1G_04986 [Cytospora mali]|uniref:Uncharacterized protein n=1 Tax=Cytospora mali TaxID=578113 RepID=A0A194V1D8_CYTMA|nr:hypothetical protein VP1G_04986 [Valsa mali var. pyri (nom. inval.)]